jgi:hypothetical protein
MDFKRRNTEGLRLYRMNGCHPVTGPEASPGPTWRFDHLENISVDVGPLNRPSADMSTGSTGETSPTDKLAFRVFVTIAW